MQSKIYKLFVAAITFYLLPFVTFAFPTTLAGVIEMFIKIGLAVIPLLAAIAFFVFVWGVVRFIRAAGSEKELKDSKNLLVWGVIGIFVLFSVWGIIAFIRNEFDFGGGKPVIPQIEF